MRRVLVIDDSEISQLVLAKLFEKLNWEVVSVSTALQALIALEKDAFDLITVDYHMPIINGQECVALIQERMNQIELPKIVMITAETDNEVYARLRRMGVAAYLPKPVTLEMLEKMDAEFF